MVHSDTGRLQRERKELARSCKEKIWEIEELGDFLLMTHMRQT